MLVVVLGWTCAWLGCWPVKWPLKTGLQAEVYTSLVLYMRCSLAMHDQGFIHLALNGRRTWEL